MRGLLNVIMYHYVRPIINSKYPNIKGLELNNFKEQLDFLRKNHNLMTRNEFFKFIQGGNIKRKNLFLLTFDDGYIDHFNYVLTELKKRNIFGLFFPTVIGSNHLRALDVNKIHFILNATTIPSKLIKIIEDEILKNTELHTLKNINYYKEKFFHKNRFDSAEVNYIKRILQKGLPYKFRIDLVDKIFKDFVSIDEKLFCSTLYMNNDMIKTLISDGMWIGGHSNSHKWLDELSDEEQAYELSTSKDFLINNGVDKELLTFCYPYGGYNLKTIKLLEENNYKSAFTCVPESFDLSVINKNFLEIPRFDCNDLYKINNFK